MSDKTHRRNCEKCGDDIRPGKVLFDDAVDMGTPDFANQGDDNRGQTFTMKSSGRLHDCYKCSGCGHSWIES